MRRDTDREVSIVAKYAVLAPVLDERARRLWAAAEAAAIGGACSSGSSTPRASRSSSCRI